MQPAASLLNPLNPHLVPCPLPCPLRPACSQLLRSTALTFWAAVPHIQAEAASAHLPSGGAFELFGLDYLLDEQGHPWLLEVVVVVGQVLGFT